MVGGLYSATTSAHGYIKSPISRAAQFYNNGWQANAVEAPKLPTGSTMDGEDAYENRFDFPPDGKLANGGADLNGIGSDALNNEHHKWILNPMKPGKQDFVWSFAAPHRTTYFTYYITKQDWKTKPGYGEKLTREMFEDEPFCHDVWASGRAAPPFTMVNSCTLPQRTGEQKIYAVWRIRDSWNAFYQMIDADFGNSDGGGGEIQKPIASINYTTNILSTSNLTLDGSKSSGNDLKYRWAITTNADKVTLENSQSSKANIRLKAEPDSDFNVDIKLTVTNAKNESDTKTVTLKAQAEVDTTVPVAVAGKDFTVTSNSESRGYDLDGSASKNAVSYKWTIVSGQAIGTLQTANGQPWVNTVNAVKARAVIKPNTTGKVTYRLTVKDKNNKTDYSDITVTVKPEQILPEEGTWDRNKIYDKLCQKVTYNGNTWLNGWWTRADQPGADGIYGVWRKVGDPNMHHDCK